MWSSREIIRVCDLAMAQIGKPYEIGGKGPDGVWIVKGKPTIYDKEPKSFDCSGFTRWVIAQGQADDQSSVIIPHGCIDQLKYCRPVGAEPVRVLDLGFADLSGNDGAPDHVVIKISETEVIEARGKPYNAVILRPIAAWEAQRGFLGFWRVPGIRSK